MGGLGLIGEIDRWKFLAHPLTLLLVGAVVSGFGVPWVTSRWQIRQRKLDLKSELVRDVSDQVTSVVRFVQYMDVGAKDPADRRKEVLPGLRAFWLCRDPY